MANIGPLRFSRRTPRLAEPDVTAPAREPEAAVIVRVILRLQPETPAVSRDYATSILLSAARSLDLRLVDKVAVAVGELVTASYVAGATSVEFGLELHADHVAAVVRDDRRPAGSESSFGGTGVRDAFLDALTTSRSVVEDAVGTVNVARFSLAHA